MYFKMQNFAFPEAFMCYSRNEQRAVVKFTPATFQIRFFFFLIDRNLKCLKERKSVLKHRNITSTGRLYFPGFVISGWASGPGF